MEAQGFNSWPIMVKPELAFSGNGITIIDNKDQLHSAVNHENIAKWRDLD